MKLQIKSAFNILLIITLCMALFYYKERKNMIGISQISYTELITVQYSPAELRKLKKTIDESRYLGELLDKKKLQRNYNFECVRTLTGRHEIFEKNYSYDYVILQDTSGGLLYIYFKEDGKVFASYYYTFVPTKDDFSKITENKMVTEGRVREIDPNTYDMDTSGRLVTGHIVQEGVYVLDYASRGEAFVSVKKFYEDSEDLEWLYYLIPGILDIDKQEMIRQFS